MQISFCYITLKSLQSIGYYQWVLNWINIMKKDIKSYFLKIFVFFKNNWTTELEYADILDNCKALTLWLVWLSWTFIKINSKFVWNSHILQITACSRSPSTVYSECFDNADDERESRNNRIESGTSLYWKNYSAYQISQKSVRDSVLFFEPITFLQRHITNTIDLNPVDRSFFTLDKFFFFFTWTIQQYTLRRPTKRLQPWRSFHDEDWWSCVM